MEIIILNMSWSEAGVVTTSTFKPIILSRPRKMEENEKHREKKIHFLLIELYTLEAMAIKLVPTASTITTTAVILSLLVHIP